MTLREKVARLIVQGAGDSISWDEAYLKADAAIALVVEECARVAEGRSAMYRKKANEAGGWLSTVDTLQERFEFAAEACEYDATAIRALAKPATEGEG